MSLIDVAISDEYHTLEDDVIENFYIPCLSEAVSYHRITGFFTGVTFQMLGKGLSKLIQSGGNMKMIISTRLSREEEEAINNGYQKREVVEQNLLSRFNDPTDEFEKGYLSLLTYLISHNILDIRVVAVNSGFPTAMEHEKIGVFFDSAGNVVAFSGSGNETPSGLMHNSEDFDVYCSWKGEDPYKRCFNKMSYFNKLWNGHFPNATTMTFPQAVKDKIFQYQNYLSKTELENLDKKYIKAVKTTRALKQADKKPSLGEVELHEYQIDAINALKNNQYRGYFDMATGTGKTYTALGGLVKLVNDPDIKTKSFLAVVVVPYTHLATQWAGECHTFGITPLLAFGNSKTWSKKFEDIVTSIKYYQSFFECVVITTASLQLDFVLEKLSDPLIAKRTIFIADEAHNLGANKIKKVLDIDFKYRIGLSATIERHHDEPGTKKLLDFFEKCCIHYDLQKAITEGFLSHYRYYPILVNLDDEELDKYVELSKEISKRMSYENADESETLKRLLLKRALLVAGCKMKIDALKETILPFKNSFYNLVYCGAVSYVDAEDMSEETQLLTVTKMLNKELKMKFARFTSQEDNDQRTAIKEYFETKTINGIVAIKCLDEGVNIPCISRAFILASSTNPKEYIQRRGRVLRQFDPKEKPFAEIYDFITISRPLEDLKYIDEEHTRIESSLAKREIVRIKEFSAQSDNSADSFSLIAQLKEIYHLNDFDMEDVDDE